MWKTLSTYQKIFFTLLESGFIEINVKCFTASHTGFHVHFRFILYFENMKALGMKNEQGISICTMEINLTKYEKIKSNMRIYKLI